MTLVDVRGPVGGLVLATQISISLPFLMLPIAYLFSDTSLIISASMVPALLGGLLCLMVAMRGDASQSEKGRLRKTGALVMVVTVVAGVFVLLVSFMLGSFAE